MRHVVWGTAGHIDHGKTTLVKALTGTDCDRLPEERERLLAAMGRFVKAAERDPDRRSLNPLFGWLSLSTWTRFHARHLDHHLRQFGV